MKQSPPEEDQQTRLARLYKRWSQPLVRMLQGRLGSRSAAEDTMQQVFVRMAATGNLPQPDKESAYLMRAAINQSVDQWRKQDRAHVFEHQSLDALDEDEATSLACHSQHEVEEQAQRQQQLARLQEAMAELPPRQREAFSLHMIEGYSQAEVAQQMVISERMVARHVSLALAYCEMRLQYGSLEQMQRLQNEAETENTVPKAASAHTAAPSKNKTP